MTVAGGAYRAIVFGGAGFLGSFVADALSEAGHRVVVFDRVASPYLRDDQVGIVGDILDREAVEAAVASCDVVYNYAGIADIEAASRDPLESVRVNVLGNTVILEAARRANVKRYVFASTLYVYSTAGAFYRCTKQACELIVEDYERAFALPYTILRYGSLYGPRAGETNWISTMLRQALLDGRVRRLGVGEEIREYIHVWDAARSSVDILAPDFANTHVIISGQQSIRIRDLLSMVQAMLGDRLQIEYLDEERRPDAAGLQLHYHVSPYSFNPKIARKVIRTSYVDLGQGLLDLMNEVYQTEHGLRESDGVLVEEPVGARDAATLKPGTASRSTKP
jgi:UDP-glucose 4-epimerase